LAKIDVRAIPIFLTEIVKNIKASEEANTASLISAQIASVEGRVIMKSWKSNIRKTGRKKIAPRRFWVLMIVAEEYFIASFFRKMIFTNAEKTAKNSNKTPRGDALNLNSKSSTIINTPVKEIKKPRILIPESFSPNAIYPRNGVKTGMVAIITAAMVGETSCRPKLSPMK
jgi:hypothetical protein